MWLKLSMTSFSLALLVSLAWKRNWTLGITDWGPELWTTARVAQLAMAEWIVLSPTAASEFDFEFHSYDRLRDRIAARKHVLRARHKERGLGGWDNVLPLE